jgi:hypothetical protein
MAAAVSESESESDFYGFGPEDLENIERKSDSDFDVSSITTVSTPNTSELEPSSSDSESNAQSDAGSVSQAPRAWTPTLLNPTVPAFTQPTGAAFQLAAEAGELDFFLKFFPDNLLSQIIDETNRYAAESIAKKADSMWQPVTLPEFKAFLGLHVLLSIVPMPSHKLAWTTNRLFRHQVFGDIMTRDRFERILKYFHVNDTTTNPPRGEAGHDRLALVRPTIDQVNRNCLENYLPSKEASIDEAMIAYRGRLSFKQYLPAKPTKFGVKVWVRADPNNGYVNQFDIYTGRDAKAVAHEDGLGARVVKHLCQPLHGKNHHVYMDNFFSSPKLFTDLQADGVYCCGTLRLNRKGVPAGMKAKRLVRKQGDFAIYQKGNLTATAWKDKKQVNFLATNSDPTEIDFVKRRQKDGTRVDIVCPVVCKMYSLYMFGVDRADQLRMQYSSCRKAVKWWKYIFWFLFDLSVCNGFVCMRESANHQITTRRGKLKARTQVDFRMKLTDQLIGEYRGVRKRRATPTIDLAGFAHWPVKAEKRGRCKRCSQLKRRHEVLVMCEQCQVYLCIDNGCFKDYHVELLSMDD